GRADYLLARHGVSARLVPSSPSSTGELSAAASHAATYMAYCATSLPSASRTDSGGARPSDLFGRLMMPARMRSSLLCRCTVAPSPRSRVHPSRFLPATTTRFGLPGSRLALYASGTGLARGSTVNICRLLSKTPSLA